MSKTVASSTQAHLPLAGIQDGVIIMNDGSVRAVLKIEPINFDLKSESEQNGIIYSYQGFLNSLEFPIQIVVQSKKLDLERYLAKLTENEKNMNNDLLQIQLEDYVEFVRRLISIANIMAKRFYVVVSYGVDAKLNPVTSFSSMFAKQATGPVLEQDQFERYRGEINNRASLVGNGLSRLGLTVRQLDTQQLIELFYAIYNPDIATEERLSDISNLSAGVVSGGETTTTEETEPQPEPQPQPMQPAVSPEPIQAVVAPVQTPPAEVVNEPADNPLTAEPDPIEESQPVPEIPTQQPPAV